MHRDIPAAKSHSSHSQIFILTLALTLAWLVGLGCPSSGATWAEQRDLASDEWAVQVVNDSDVPIHHVYVRRAAPASDDYWGEDRLAGDVLDPRDFYVIRGRAEGDAVDVRVVGASGRSQDHFNIPLSLGDTVSVDAGDDL